MAINPETQYPGKITASSANYPYGEARNITVPGDGTGTPWEAALVNDIFGMQQALLSEAGITPTGNPETAVASQYLNAMHTLNPRIFDTYDTDLAAYTPLGDEQVVYCKGKASVGDGGAGLFYYDLASTTWLPLFGYTNSRGLKNKIINGDFDLWDYAASQTSSGYGSDNRWLNEHSGSTKTNSQQAFTIGQTDVPGNPDYFSRIIPVTGSGISDYVRKCQRIEFVSTFSGETVTLSFWAKADAARDIATEFSQNFGTSGSPSSQVNAIGVTTHSLTTSWAKYTVTVDIPSISGKTLGTDLNDYLMLTFWFDAGSNFDARTNSLGNQSGTFDVAKVQVEAGPAATAFEERLIEVEKSLANRHLRVFDSSASGSAIFFGSGYIASSTSAFGQITLNTQLRATPSWTLLSGSLAMSTGTGGYTPTTLTPIVVDNSHFYANFSGMAGLTVGQGCIVGIASASKGYFEAEL